MKQKLKIIFKISLLILFPSLAFAVIPGAVDAGRIVRRDKNIQPKEAQGEQFIIPNVTHSAPSPEEAKKIEFTLKKVNIEGMTIFSPSQMQDIYAKYLNQKSSLSIAWEIVDKITKTYRDKGYFLSRAYIPEQTIKNGEVTIKVVEGYIGDVELPKNVKSHSVVQKYIDKIKLEKPVTIDKVESFLLRLSDLPGYSFRSVISPIEGEEGATKITLIPSTEKGRGEIIFDNFSSRYIGTNEITASYSKSFIPLQKTIIAAVSSTPANKQSYAGITHSIVVLPNTTLSTFVNTSKTYPGHTLQDFNIESSANSSGIGLSYQFIRQRHENLSTKIMINTINNYSNIMGSPLVRDNIRMLRTALAYDFSDKFAGNNNFNVLLTQGIDGLGSSSANDSHLSRAGAKPNFTKATFNISRIQEITKNCELFLSSVGQASSGTLYSSEQFGYGGQSFGKAYDYSEIMGDQGINAALELRYNTLNNSENIKAQLYGFYDIGSVSNRSSTNANSQSGASAGLGFKFNTKWYQSGNIGFAWPLTRDIATPIYGDNKRRPRFMFQISQEF